MISPLAFKDCLTVAEAGKLISKECPPEGISLVLNAIDKDNLKCLHEVRHEYHTADWDQIASGNRVNEQHRCEELNAENPPGTLDVQKTIVALTALKDWLREINYPPIPEFPVDPTTEGSKPKADSRLHVSDNMAILCRAEERFWKNADPKDKGTHHTNAEVIVWLVEHGLSDTLAKKAATLIRPPWASTGRKPEK